MDNQLTLDRVTISYDGASAVADVSFALPEGDIGCLLGPSGCGKTSLLRAIAGFEPVAAGAISLRGHTISTPQYAQVPEERAVGMVFQDFALFPHLSVSDNIGFGLPQGSPDERRARIAEMLDLVGLSNKIERYPHELSGGQQQRVALARALAPNPKILLLDEPFSNLDSVRRSQLAGEIRALLKRSKVTALLVTHDQDEAFAMADQIVLLNHGRVDQIGTPRELYQRPATLFAADFIGAGNLIDIDVDAAGNLDAGWGKLTSLQWPEQCAGRIKLLLRPDVVVVDDHAGHELNIVEKIFQGANHLYQLALPDGQTVACLAPSDIDQPIGDSLPVRFDLDQAVVFNGGAH